VPIGGQAATMSRTYSKARDATIYSASYAANT
jgi:hypothetical protein